MSNRVLIFDLPEGSDDTELYEMEDQGILDMVYWGAMLAHITGDQSLLMETLSSYVDLLSESGLEEHQVEDRSDRMFQSIQNVLILLKDYADPIKRYVENPLVHSVWVEDLRVYLDEGCFTITLEFDDALGDRCR